MVNLIYLKQQIDSVGQPSAMSTRQCWQHVPCLTNNCTALYTGRAHNKEKGQHLKNRQNVNKVVALSRLQLTFLLSAITACLSQLRNNLSDGHTFMGH